MRCHKYPIEIVEAIENTRKNQIQIEFVSGKFSVGTCKRQSDIVQKASVKVYSMQNLFDGRRRRI